MIKNALMNLAAILPAPVFIIFAEQETTRYTPSVLEQQGWVMTAIAAGLALTRIALWLRGSNGHQNGMSKTIERIEIANLDKVLSTVSNAVNKLGIEQNRILDREAITGSNIAELAKAINELKDSVNELKFIIKRN